MIVNWNDKVMELFSDFSNVEFQKSTWFGLVEEIASPDEMCNWVDDIDLEGWLLKRSPFSNPYIETCIRKFLRSIDKLPQTMDPCLAYSSAEWASLRLQADVIHKLLSKEPFNIN